MVTAGALAEVHECRERTLLGYLRVGAPLLAMAAARAVAAVAARAWRPHPLDWSIHEEVQTLVMREVLSKRDLGVWRAMFSVGEITGGLGWAGKARRAVGFWGGARGGWMLGVGAEEGGAACTQQLLKAAAV
jgi:hypothetical protein